MEIEIWKIPWGGPFDQNHLTPQEACQSGIIKIDALEKNTYYYEDTKILLIAHTAWQSKQGAFHLEGLNLVRWLKIGNLKGWQIFEILHWYGKYGALSWVTCQLGIPKSLYIDQWHSYPRTWLEQIIIFWRISPFDFLAWLCFRRKVEEQRLKAVQPKSSICHGIHLWWLDFKEKAWCRILHLT